MHAKQRNRNGYDADQDGADQHSLSYFSRYACFDLPGKQMRMR